jgi:hypothetical protein
MLECIASPANVLAFRAVGKIEKADYDDVLEPAVAAQIAAHGEVRFVYVLGPEFDRYSIGAGWEDAQLGIGHLSKWKRVALVTDEEWIRHALSMFGWMVPGEVKSFALPDEDAAIEWAAG